jgi:hypothetical protein
MAATLTTLLALAVAAAAETAGAQEAPMAGSRVRTTNAVISTAIASGIERSPTFRQRLAEIEATDGLVYVDAGTCGNNSVAACLVPSLVVAGPSRLLRIFVDLRKANGCRLVATIGHEMQHAVEVLRDPSVRSGEAMYFLFARIGPVSSGPFETTAAKQTTLRVDREACRAR